MKKCIKILSLFTFIFYYTINSVAQVDVSSKIKNSESNLVIIDLIKQLDSIANYSTLKQKNISSIYSVFLLIENEPKYKYESSEIYKLITKIVSISESDGDYLQLFIDISFLTKRNAEISQYLSELTHQLALRDCQSFIELYHKQPKNKKEMVDADLFWLVEYDKSKEFLSCILNIKNDAYKKDINHLCELLQ